MNIEMAFEVAAAVIFSLGGGSVIVFAFSNWLGKVWANRLMAQESARHNHELEELRANLQVQAGHFSHVHREKIDLYKEVSNPLIELVVKAQQQHGGLTPDDLKIFDTNRLKTTALLAMFAPKNVFDEYNNLIEYIYNSVEGKEMWSFQVFRVKALKFLSLVRADIGLYTDEVTYTGNR